MDFFIQYFDIIFKIAAVILAAYGVVLSLRSQINRLAGDINHIKENQKSLQEAFSQLGSILTKVAVQDTRLNMIEKKLDELSHGQGFVTVRN